MTYTAEYTFITNLNVVPMPSESQNLDPQRSSSCVSRLTCSLGLSYGGAGQTGDIPPQLSTSVFLTLILIILSGILSSCGQGFGGGGRSQSSQFQPGLAFLLGDQPEKKGYGLYSYLLFESPPTDEYRKLYLSAIWACVEEIPDIDQLARNYSPQQINAIYIPVTDPLPPPPQGQSRNETLKWWSEEILKLYNYKRARLLINRLPKVQTGKGPYLLSAFSPVTDANASLNDYLFQDLSLIPADRPKIAYEWVADFILRAGNPLSSAWDQKILVKITRDFRASRLNSQSARDAGLDEAEIKRAIWLTCISFPDPDCGSNKAQDDERFSAIRYTHLIRLMRE